jgi:AcrR family transcriptional regulator
VGDVAQQLPVDGSAGGSADGSVGGSAGGSVRGTVRGAGRGAVDGGPDAWSGRRADARRNHERVLAAAIEVFTEHGLDATIPQVAARAGVGKATVYRSYPTKADLIGAIAQLHVDWLRALIGEAVGRAEVDAYGALSDALHAVTARLAQDRLMGDVLTHVEDWEPDSATDSSAERILALGRQQGTLRQDVTMRDVQVLIGGIAHVLLDLGIDDAATWDRYTTLALAALRP